MAKTRLLDNIGQGSIKMMIPCFKPIKKKYRKGDTILTYESGKISNIAVMSQGTARLEILNEDGDLFLLERYGAGDVFGELFSLPLENFDYIVKALSDCTVIYLDYNHIISPCETLCDHHSQLISNLFMMTAQKAQELSLHISILGQSCIRSKLMTYLKHIRSRSFRDSESPESNRLFTIPMSLVHLSEYLMVDRSSMMREIRAMKDDGLIESKNRQF